MIIVIIKYGRVSSLNSILCHSDLSGFDITPTKLHIDRQLSYKNKQHTGEQAVNHITLNL